MDGLQLTAFDASSLNVAEKQAIRDEAHWMSLEYVVVSVRAKALVERVRFQPKAARPSSILKAQEATGAILADLAVAERDGVWSKLSLRSNTFTVKLVKYHSFNCALKALEAAGVIDRLAGYSDRTGFGHVGRVSCFRFSQQGKSLLEQEGIDPQTSIAAHFKRRQ